MSVGSGGRQMDQESGRPSDVINRRLSIGELKGFDDALKQVLYACTLKVLVQAVSTK